MLLRSWSNTLLSVRQATQRNAGRKTAGIDGQVALTSQTRMELAVQVHRDAKSWRPRPVKRVYIPKAGNRAKLRPLGIPVIADRCHQGRVRSALEPEWEARFEPKSYGFRPGRGCPGRVSSRMARSFQHEGELARSGVRRKPDGEDCSAGGGAEPEVSIT